MKTNSDKTERSWGMYNTAYLYNFGISLRKNLKFREKPWDLSNSWEIQKNFPNPWDLATMHLVYVAANRNVSICFDNLNPVFHFFGEVAKQSKHNQNEAELMCYKAIMSGVCFSNGEILPCY